ncbi:DUF5719 family protein [Nocardioides sp. Kera G14]|uniref:DUF5719 family protein n=1 Tax=Nocardioides sp. Kera G14 TaxID=2884264 RepID=UPI001D0FBD70|nr:DUF5719 family protein [Nocardioides sp. Kera G14]UDY22746.1 DUF5719 family protein [Nocardioides sp. Kera G14]
MNRSTRRRRRFRLDATVILMVALPVVVALALALTRPDAPRIEPAAPSHAALTSATVICPTALAGKGATSAQLLRARGTGVAASAPAASDVIRATGDQAPGLVASLVSDSPLTAWDCTPPAGDEWFTGVGAGPTQASVVELVNPNTGPAVADLTVLGDHGPVDVPQLRGIRVEPGETVQRDLGQLVPTTGVLALHLSVVRGQVGVAVRDRGERLTGGTSTEDWLAPQAAPASRNRLLGLQPGSGHHTLAIANDGDNQISATVKLVSADSTFSPDGLEPIDVPPHSVISTSLDTVVDGAIAKGALGLEVSATGPVTTSLRSVVSGDLSFLVPGGRVDDSTTVLLPAGPKRLVLAGADAVGVANVTGRNASGTVVVTERIALAPDRGASLDLPADVASLDVAPSRTSLEGAVLLTGGGSAVLRLRELERSGAVPVVSFGP